MNSKVLSCDNIVLSSAPRTHAAGYSYFVQTRVEEVPATEEAISVTVPQALEAAAVSIPPAVAEWLKALPGQIEAFPVASSELTAPVAFPTREKLAVQLVDLSLLDHLEEYRTDDNLGYVAIGVLADFLANMVIPWFIVGRSEITEGSVYLALALLLLLGVLIIWVRRLRDRIAQIKDEMFDY